MSTPSESAETSAAANSVAKPGERLQKVLASAGFGSRRHCEDYILAGRVTVDGRQVRELGTRVDPHRQQIRVDGEPVKIESKRYYLLNKPPGYLCTTRDPAGRPRAIDLLPESGPRLFTVGRLDENSQGLLMVTNDGELANRLAHPRFQVTRQYRVQVAGRPTRETLAQLKRGLHFSDGRMRVRYIRRLKSRGNSTFLLITLTEGRNREIRRLLAHVGHKVMHLERIGFGPLRLGNLPLGRYRPLRPVELKAVRSLVDPAGSPGGRNPSGRGGRRPEKRKRRRSAESTGASNSRHRPRPQKG